MLSKIFNKVSHHKESNIQYAESRASGMTSHNNLSSFFVVEHPVVEPSFEGPPRKWNKSARANDDEPLVTEGHPYQPKPRRPLELEEVLPHWENSAPPAGACPSHRKCSKGEPWLSNGLDNTPFSEEFATYQHFWKRQPSYYDSQSALVVAEEAQFKHTPNPARVPLQVADDTVSESDMSFQCCGLDNTPYLKSPGPASPSLGLPPIFHTGGPQGSYMPFRPSRHPLLDFLPPLHTNLPPRKYPGKPVFHPYVAEVSPRDGPIELPHDNALFELDGTNAPVELPAYEFVELPAYEAAPDPPLSKKKKWSWSSNESGGFSRRSASRNNSDHYQEELKAHAARRKAFTWRWPAREGS